MKIKIAGAIEIRQRANGCNQDNDPGAWGRPCCDGCLCASEALKPTHPREPSVEISMSPEMIEQVFGEWEAEHPGKRAHSDMGSDEFATRMMVKIRASARFVPDA